MRGDLSFTGTPESFLQPVCSSITNNEGRLALSTDSFCQEISAKPLGAIPYHPLLPQELRFSEVGSSGKSHFKRSLKRIGDVLAVVGALRPLRLQGANTSREW